MRRQISIVVTSLALFALLATPAHAAPDPNVEPALIDNGGAFTPEGQPLPLCGSLPAPDPSAPNAGWMCVPAKQLAQDMPAGISPQSNETLDTGYCEGAVCHNYTSTSKKPPYIRAIITGTLYYGTRDTGQLGSVYIRIDGSWDGSLLRVKTQTIQAKSGGIIRGGVSNAQRVGTRTGTDVDSNPGRYNPNYQTPAWGVGAGITSPQLLLTSAGVHVFFTRFGFGIIHPGVLNPSYPDGRFRAEIYTKNGYCGAGGASRCHW